MSSNPFANVSAAAMEKLRTLTAGGDADGTYGQSRIAKWPNFGQKGTHSYRGTIVPSINFEAKFTFKPDAAPGAKVDKVERPAFSVEFDYELEKTDGERCSCSGEPMIIPYDTTGLPKGSETRVDMSASRLAASCMNFLGMDPAVWKASFNSPGVGWFGMLKQVWDKHERMAGTGSRVIGKIDLSIRETTKKVPADGGGMKDVVFTNGEDVIRSVENA